MFNKFTKAILSKNVCSLWHKTIRHQSEVPSIVMNNGNEMPIIGLGTFNTLSGGKEGQDEAASMAKAVEQAIDAGYRHLDCAHVYENQKAIGKAIQKKIEKADVAREDLFITGKLWNTSHDPENVCKACEQTLAELKLDYLDMFLMHTPMGFPPSDDLYPQGNCKVLHSDVDYIETWKAMEELVAKKLCTNIGISNFNKQQIKRLLKNCTIIPQTLQIELHPYLTQQQLIHYAKCHDICVTAYAPLGSPARVKAAADQSLLQDYKILEIAEKHKRSPAQILLRFQVQGGQAVIPKSTQKKHLVDNLNIFGFELSANDVKNIESLNHNARYFEFHKCTGHRYHPFEANEQDSC